MFQSTTKGVLHFEDLSPQQFEDLYRNILHITGDYQDIRAYGIKGSDDGVDIFCTEKATGLNFYGAQNEAYITKISLNPFVFNTFSQIL